MLIPLSIVDDVAVLDLGQELPRTQNNMLPVFVLFDSRAMSHYHHPTTSTTTPSSSSHNHNNVPTRLMYHNRNNVSSRPTVSVVDETLLYDSSMANNIPRRSRSFNHPHHHHNNGTRASSTVIGAAAVVMGVQEHVTTSTGDAESICSICLVDLSNASSTPIGLRCSHVFHTHCIQKWINIRKTCPLCRANV
ncbi:RING-H2 finger protein ATL79-like [Vicia villosa]|uniref:RING-H2 finger protein ATL79-like n=1 Tax=Vicia villosa TaxID=3911 RepID=UPI00273C891D|nr:RING-H2 finger protein ATL79-like [Vicia villosa]